jgi:hypothetical protein
MVEGGDRTDRSSACSGSGDDGRKPDSPEQFNRNHGPKRPSKSAGHRNPLPAPRLAALTKSDSKSDLSSEIPRLSWLVGRKLVSTLRWRGAAKP